MLRTALDAPAGLPASKGFELEYVRAHLHQYNRQYGGFISNGRRYIFSNMYLSDSVIEEDSSFLTDSLPGEEGAPPGNGFTMIADGGAVAVRALFDAETRTLVHIECNGH